ncbi:MAG: nitroreductase family protein [Actinomycetota bacterium]
MNSDDFYDRILGLRALRSYRDEPIPDNVIEQILEAARWTGSSKNRQKWSFILVDGEQRDRLAECGDFTDPVRAAPIALALVEEDMGYEFDTGRVAQNVMLAADALGLASCPITLHRDGDVAAVLGLPEGARCRYAISIGYPALDAAPRRFGGRKPLGDVAYRNRHGDSWSGRD